ncbi:uncharacterized protein I206_105850 [Kwoniella pini CBS 10737]|uniref:Uncharacterized protein n=1 Tax=Kwoniella pini CBS 10737 TaxID=1296096 RepID=A0A1B9I0B6_9TREE|nr:uncharacterized protein I206_04670 [Kwoniella pini CBS 10737]OCF48983.1 hypothetical protein I206_04670 [Kwoniella pini CBS 10737]
MPSSKEDYDHVDAAYVTVTVTAAEAEHDAGNSKNRFNIEMASMTSGQGESQTSCFLRKQLGLECQYTLSSLTAEDRGKQHLIIPSEGSWDNSHYQAIYVDSKFADTVKGALEDGQPRTASFKFFGCYDDETSKLELPIPPQGEANVIFEYSAKYRKPDHEIEYKIGSFDEKQSDVSPASNFLQKVFKNTSFTITSEIMSNEPTGGIAIVLNAVGIQSRQSKTVNPADYNYTINGSSAKPLLEESVRLYEAHKQGSLDDIQEKQDTITNTEAEMFNRATAVISFRARTFGQPNSLSHNPSEWSET